MEEVNSVDHSPDGFEKKDFTTTNYAKEDVRIHVTDAEWTNANRAFRTATWAACFYLITTDILGPFGVG